MHIFNRYFAGSTVVLVAFTLGGCATPSTSSYPSVPPGAKSGMDAADPGQGAPMTSGGMPMVVKVPKDAVDLSHGDYPPPAFPTPDKPGLIMVVDMDSDPDTAVASTMVTGQNAGKMMSITDIANMSVTMNKMHKFKIVFVPSQTGMTTTMP